MALLSLQPATFTISQMHAPPGTTQTQGTPSASGLPIASNSQRPVPLLLLYTLLGFAVLALDRHPSALNRLLHFPG